MKDPNEADSKAPLQDSPAGRGARSRRRGALTQVTEPVTDGEVSEADSTCSHASGLQEPTVRITRRRRIIIPCQPESRTRARQRAARSESIKSGDEGEVSESESCSSVLSGLLASPVRTRRARQRETKFRLDPNSALLAEETSDAESWCSGISSVGSRRSTRSRPRSRPRKSKEETEVRAGEGDKDEKRDERAVPPLPEDISESAGADTPRSEGQQSAPSSGSTPGPCKDELQESVGESAEEKPKLQTRGERGTKAEESLEEKNLNIEPHVLEKEKETHCEELEQSSFEKQLISQSQSTPDKTKLEHKMTDADRVRKAFVLLVECNMESKQNEKAEEINDITEIAGNENSDCKVSIIEDTDDGKEHLKGDISPSSLSSRSQDNNDTVLLALSNDEEEDETGENTLCFIEDNEQKLSPEKDSEDNPSSDVLFVIDKTPGLSSDKNFYIEEEKASEVASEQENEVEEEEEEESEEEETVDQEEKEDEFIDEDDLLSNTKSNHLKLSSSSIDPGLSIKQLGGLYINFNAEKMDFHKKALTQIKEKTKKELLQKTIITPDFEKKDCIPPYKESQFQLKKKRREERKKTAGDGWFGMKAPELTTELKNDLKALQMRASMDPKRFYKKNDRDGFPKYFQVGTIADNPADFYHSRIPKKQRKRTIVEELLADSEFRRYNKRKYTEIMMEKANNAAGKKFRKKKKFRN
ncbi:deoxynucleotidyltransferase terminal-interacting protein 2 isoform X2 [Sminthopsis crassicaudata]